ncbi:MAG: UDP-N-acetylglucosamine 2-epimerase (non-hydrolyzing) [Bacteroidetes bacterium]|nr:UDP-N-acetylglucosamine 2-epimerase (non-hydrolyzing) [Bacteroidota bacterium]
MDRKKIILVFGTRPEAIKMAPVYFELQKNSHIYDVKVCLTGQHRTMLEQVMDFFKIPTDFDLSLMKENQSLSDLSASVLTEFSKIIVSEKPDMVLVHGDTTTSSMATLAAYYHKIKIGHVEAGLRTHNKYSPFPEEINRQITGRIADYHFSPTSLAEDNLLSEGIEKNKILVTGNTVIDALHWTVDLIENNSYEDDEIRKVSKIIQADKKLILVTGHRRENFGDGFLNICNAMKALAETHPEIQIIYPVHLNPNVKKPVYEILKDIYNIHLIAPINYPAFVFLMNKSHIILTDSGGVQEEGPSLGKPVLVMRENTERPEAVDAGTVKLVGTNSNSIISSVEELLTDDKLYTQMSTAINPYGDGLASKKIVEFIKDNFKKN